MGQNRRLATYRVDLGHAPLISRRYKSVAEMLITLSVDVLHYNLYKR
jgi:hypothetical protein